MKGWQPRQPSPGLRNRIFAPEAARAEMAGGGGVLDSALPFDWASLTRWLVPAVGCFIMMTATLTDPDVPLPDGSRPLSEGRAPVAIAWHNNAPATTLEWTFARPSSSSNDPFVRTETNTLIK